MTSSSKKKKEKKKDFQVRIDDNDLSREKILT
jgi:hypothetical protein